MALSKDMDLWHPDFRSAVFPGRDGGPGASGIEDRVRAVADLARTPAAGVLDRLVTDRPLKNLLGAMGSEPPEMSWLNLAIMWNVMAEEGIWFPEPGVHVLADLLRERLVAAGGELRLATPVRKVVVKDGRATGVVTASGEFLAANWIVSNADYKTTFLELVDAAGIPGVDLEAVRGAPYTASELCVYLGLRPDEVDLAAMRADHLFYRHEIRSGDSGPEDFDNREIEICLWSRMAPRSSRPAGLRSSSGRDSRTPASSLGGPARRSGARATASTSGRWPRSSSGQPSASCPVSPGPSRSWRSRPR